MFNFIINLILNFSQAIFEQIINETVEYKLFNLFINVFFNKDLSFNYIIFTVMFLLVTIKSQGVFTFLILNFEFKNLKLNSMFVLKNA